MPVLFTEAARFQSWLDAETAVAELVRLISIEYRTAADWFDSGLLDPLKGAILFAKFLEPLERQPNCVCT